MDHPKTPAQPATGKNRMPMSSHLAGLHARHPLRFTKYRDFPLLHVCGPRNNTCGPRNSFGACYGAFPVKDSLRNSRHDAPGTWNQAVLLRLVLMLVEQVHVDKAPGEEGPAADINLPLQA
jgi:hypothetical protein